MTDDLERLALDFYSAVKNILAVRLHGRARDDETKEVAIDSIAATVVP